MTTAKFALTAKQEEANALLGSPATHILLAGGSRSGKTFLLIRAIVIRALKAPASRHAVVRYRFGHVKQSIVNDTFPKVMQLCFPEVKYDLNKSELYVTFPNLSQILFLGLDDKERTEKILGTEFVTIFFEECSQIQYPSRNMALTRLAQKVTDKLNSKPLTARAYYACNPPTKAHWTYKLFLAHEEPDSRQPVQANDYAFMKLNPYDNVENLDENYIAKLQALPARERQRFLEGEFADATPGQLFSEDIFERWRVLDGELPQMLRVVVAVDPSGADDKDNTDNDAIGIVVAGLGIDGVAYILEDLTCKAGPATWGRVATDAFQRHQADRVVGEINYGGAMVGYVIKQSRPNTPYRSITASRGKTVRAEPVAALMETGKVRIVGTKREMCDELLGFTTYGYMGEHSPNRADACIYACSDLFPELLKAQEPKPMPRPRVIRPTHWMNA